MSTKEQKIQGRKSELPALCFLNLSAHFYVWVTVWVRRLTHILTHTVSGEKARKIPEIIRFQGFSVRRLQSGYFEILCVATDWGFLLSFSFLFLT